MQLRQLLEMVPDGLMILDDSSRILLCNDRLAMPFGYAFDELSGQPFEVLIPAGAAGLEPLRPDRLIEEGPCGGTVLGLQLLGRHRDGHTFPVEVILRALDSGDRRWVTAAIRFTDVGTSPQATSLVGRAHQAIRAGLTTLAAARHGRPFRLPGLMAAARLAAAEDRRLAAADRREAARLLADAYRDELTGTVNRRPGRAQIRTEIDRARRTTSSLAVIFLDIDGLKQVNDGRGHGHGDDVLAATGLALKSTLRSYDVVVRYGGDEFVCALPGGTPESATASIRRIRRRLADLAPGVTVSAGQAQLLPGDTIDDVVRRADADLYRLRHHQHPKA